MHSHRFVLVPKHPSIDSHVFQINGRSKRGERGGEEKSIDFELQKGSKRASSYVSHQTNIHYSLRSAPPYSKLWDYKQDALPAPFHPPGAHRPQAEQVMVSYQHQRRGSSGVTVSELVPTTARAILWGISTPKS